MTSLIVEQFGSPSSPRAARVLELARRRAVDELAGRTVWSATALPAGHAPARMLSGDVRAAGRGGIGTGSIEVPTDESLRTLAERLDAMLHGFAPPASSLGPAERGLYERASPAGEALGSADIEPGDVVVLHDPLVAVLAQAVRERGAHAVWHVTVGPAPRRAAAEAQNFLSRFTAALDAYVTTSRRAVGRGLLGERLTALMPSADIVATMSLATERGEEPSGWCCLLAEVVQSDRDEHVGGRVHARPAVAAH